MYMKQIFNYKIIYMKKFQGHFGISAFQREKLVDRKSATKWNIDSP